MFGGSFSLFCSNCCLHWAALFWQFCCSLRLGALICSHLLSHPLAMSVPFWQHHLETVPCLHSWQGREVDRQGNKSSGGFQVTSKSKMGKQQRCRQQLSHGSSGRWRQLFPGVGMAFSFGRCSLMQGELSAHIDGSGVFLFSVSIVSSANRAR